VADAETVALVSVIASGAVGLVAVGGSLLSGWRDRMATRDAQREDRRQERVEDAYQALIAYVEKRIRIAAAIRPLLTYPNQPPAPSVDDEEVQTAQALVDLHASPEVDAMMNEFADTLRKIDDAETALKMNEDAGRKQGSDRDPNDFGWPTWAEAYKFVSRDGIDQLRAIKNRMREQMRRELNPGTKG
jgi:hypothetical protein